MKFRRSISNPSREGSTLLFGLLTVLVLAGMAATILGLTGTLQKERTASGQTARALYVAEAGVSHGVALVRADAPGVFGTINNPLAFGSGGYWGTVVDNGDDTMTVTAFAAVDRESRGIEAVMSRALNGIYSNALFAGNSSGDPNYDLEFRGNGSSGDDINGNVYSGGNVVIEQDASIDGDVVASGTISGSGSGDNSTGSLPNPDIAGMDYANNNDYDVATLFASGANYASNALGGNAWQMPETSPAHIFRKNPSDRTADTSTTAKDDYFLEDPYESVNSSSTIDPANGTHITLSGQDGNPGPSGTDKVYYIDGNLWIHNKKLYSFTMYNSGAEDIHVTFVVRGNIYMSDNLMYQDATNDAIALVAITDPNVENSGNIYFGDPTFGTLERMDSFMYAENDFYDNNLDAAGSARVTVNGNMTAGNHVNIRRDFNGAHSKLTVNFDDRLMSGALNLPGLPGSDGGGPPWHVASWREIPAPDPSGPLAAY